MITNHKQIIQTLRNMYLKNNIRHRSLEKVQLNLRVKSQYYSEPLIASNSINENTVLKRNKTNIQTNKKRFDGNDVEDLNNKKYTFSDRSPMVLGAPDSPTLTYEKRLFMKKSFEGRSNQVIQIFNTGSFTQL